ncbi:DUF2235 domain-containing protein [Rhodococcus gannanensis]|uniref:DUF2235 domain-containing protein n=1 Tax=Rhodococcus gannanensis TaxID=1960308 RepID=A0ABW4NZ79_9NOCA
MPKRLVVCCDGTWNSPDEKNPTNVSKIALAIAPSDASGKEQRTYYGSGVGTRKNERFRGGAFGVGLSRDVRNAYRFLVDNFEPGDEIYFFGFSRGAFTARSTAGFVARCGILRREHTHRIDEAYALYRSKKKSAGREGIESILFRRAYSHETWIRFVGVFDTVGSLGIPLNLWRLSGLINRRWQFHDTELSPTVDSAFHALAIDEKRRPFRPTVWAPKKDDTKTGPGEDVTPPPDPRRGRPPQQIEQVWFAGVHKDVGGGYAKHSASDITLQWMVDRARRCHLEFRAGAFDDRSSNEGQPATEEEWRLRAYTSVAPDALGELNESRRGFYKLLRGYSRPLGTGLKETEYVASTAKQRLELPGYAPRGLVRYLDDSDRIMDVSTPTVAPAAPGPRQRRLPT